jgi:hypothetical protein
MDLWIYVKLVRCEMRYDGGMVLIRWGLDLALLGGKYHTYSGSRLLRYFGMDCWQFSLCEMFIEAH